LGRRFYLLTFLAWEITLQDLDFCCIIKGSKVNIAENETVALCPGVKHLYARIGI